MALSPRLVPDSNGSIYLEWDPSPDADGYYFFQDGKMVSRSFNGSLARSRVARPGQAVPPNTGLAPVQVTVGQVELANAPAPPPPDPVPSGFGSAWLSQFPRMQPAKLLTPGLFTTRIRLDGEPSVGVSGFEATGELPPDRHAFYITNCGKVLLERGLVHDLHGSGRPQAAQIQDCDEVQILGTRCVSLGDDSLDHAWYYHDIAKIGIGGALIDQVFSYPLHMYSGGGGTLGDVTVANATIARVTRDDAAVLSNLTLNGVLRFENCVFFDIPDFALLWKADAPLGPNGRVVFENCVKWQVDNGFCNDPRAELINCRTVDPMFVNPSAGDFRLKPGSPLIGAGNPAWMSPMDAFGKPFLTADIGGLAFAA